MQGTLFLTSNLSSIWHHGEFKNKRVSNKGHLCPHRNTIKCLAEVSACFCTGFPHLQFATQRQISWEEKLVIHIIHHSAGKITSSLPCGCVWGGCFLLNFVGPFFIHCLGVSYGELGSSFPTEPAFFSSVLMDHPPPNSHQISIPNPDTSCSHEPDVGLQLSLCIAFKSNAMFLSLLLNSVNTIWNKTKSRKYKQIAKQIAVYGRYYAKYFI